MNNQTGKIAFQGEPGANSDTACRDVYPRMTPLPCATFEDVFSVLSSGKVELAMIPIENTIAGRVADIHQLLPNSGLHIIGEYFLPIHFHLMVKHGVNIGDITTVYSHVHALGQCRKIIRKHRWKAVVAGDTAGSARLVAELDDTNSAALAPLLAASLYKLDILARNVEDEDHNTTRFLILSRDALVPPADNGPVITTFTFKVRNVPAALYKVMGGFATNGVNMTKLESYQGGGVFAATLFYADIEGHPDDKSVTFALEELDFFASKRILGVYPASDYRNREKK